MKPGAKLFFMGLFASVFVVVFAYRDKPGVSVLSDARFTGITNIVFSQRIGSDSNLQAQLVVSDTNILRQMISFKRLSFKRTCACRHYLKALLQSPADEVQVSFCNHCFNVSNGPKPGDFRMPKAFYTEFYRLALLSTNESEPNWKLTAYVDRNKE